jgi:non-ribosomal peptide synthetase component F
MEYSLAIELEADSLANELRFHIAFKRSILTLANAEILLQQLEQALLDILRNPSNSASIDTLAAKLPSRLLSISNQVAPALAQPGKKHYMHTWVEIGDAKIPDHPALEFADAISEKGSVASAIWSYSKLNSEANKVANLLLRMGLKGEDKVIVSMSKQILLYSSIIGVSKSGGCYVPIDTAAPLERKLLIVKDTAAKFILLSSKDRYSQIIIDSLPVGVQAILIEHLDTQNTPDDNPLVEIDADSVAYILYTSGSTGTPKGVLVEVCTTPQKIFLKSSLTSFFSTVT